MIFNKSISVGTGPDKYSYTPFITQGGNTTYMSEFCNHLTYLCTNGNAPVKKAGDTDPNVVSLNYYCASGYITDPTANTITWDVAQQSPVFHGYYVFTGNQFQVAVNANYTSEWVILRCTRTNTCGSDYSYYKFYVNSGCICPGLPYCELIAYKPALTEKYTISPNPSSGQFTITLNSADKKAVIKEVIITNKMGLTVFHQKITNAQNTQSINLPAMPTDIYMVQIFDGTEWTTQKLSIKH